MNEQMRHLNDAINSLWECEQTSRVNHALRTLVNELSSDMKQVNHTSPIAISSGRNIDMTAFPTRFKKISAIKIARYAFGLSLKEAKELIETSGHFTRDGEYICGTQEENLKLDRVVETLVSKGNKSASVNNMPK